MTLNMEPKTSTETKINMVKAETSVKSITTMKIMMSDKLIILSSSNQWSTNFFRNFDPN